MDDDDVHCRLVAASPMATWHHVVLAREGDGGVQGGRRGWLMWALLLWVIDVHAGGL